MIVIFEAPPKKISGSTSLFLDAPYSENVERIVKSLDFAVWHKKDKLWEIPLTCLAQLLDELAYEDDVRLELLPLPEETSAQLTGDYKVKPFPHQEEAIKFGLEHDNWLLLDSPGLGKTASIIHLAEELKRQRGIEHCLIICGIATLRANWEKEIKFHSDETFITIGKRLTKRGKEAWNTIPQRASQLKNKIDEFFVILNIESIRDESIVDAILNSENAFDMIAFDECHKANGTSSIQSKNLLKLNQAKYKIGMTGTLITNSPLSAFIPLKWIGVDHSTLTNYKSLYCEFGGFGGYEVIGYKNLNLLMDEIDRCSLRRTKDLMDLPPKNIITEYVEMSDAHRKFYESVEDGVKSECDLIELNINNLLALTTRLRQATSCPGALTSSGVMSSKLERCVNLVEDIVSQGDKVVIMSQFKDSVYQLQEMLRHLNPLIGTGDMKDQDVSHNIDMFQNDYEHQVIICTQQKMGTGITLNRARYLIMLDEPYTDALYTQCTDRIHRINNTEPVFIYNLICANTYDEVVHYIVSRKKALSDYMIDFKQDDETLSIIKNYIKNI